MEISEFNPSGCFAFYGMKAKIVFIINVFAFMGAAALAADAAATNSVPPEMISTNANLQKLSSLSIEQLMNVKVTILGPSETVSKTPAAVSVVTAEDIKRSGAQSIPEALRLVPGMDVAQLDASQWAVSSRGFNDEFANKLLVLQDGRSIYTLLFGGVLWDAQGTMMEDIDHIEVVRGPGATLWGANAVNGVINIITKSAQDTQGWLVNGGGGNQDLGFADARYGGKIGDNGYYRVYGTYNNHDSTELPGGGDSHNSWQLARGGFRTDWTPAEDNLFTVQGDGYWGGIHEVFQIYDPSSPTLADTVLDNIQVSGADALGRWTHTFSDTANFKLQAYYDYTARFTSGFEDEHLHIIDLNFQNEFAIGERNKMIWGLGYRLTVDQEGNNQEVSFNPENRTLNLFSGFVQDEIALVKERLALTLGTKVEHNDYTGVELEPGARLLWTPTENHTFWASVSRTVRTPTRTDEDVTLRQAAPSPPGTAVALSDNGSFKSEELLAYEIGYRTAPLKNISFDVAAFYNDYSRLSSTEFKGFSFPPPTVIVTPGNNIYGDTYGTEISAAWRVTECWRLQPAYTFLKMNLHARAGSTDTTTVPLRSHESPENQFSIRSSLDLPKDVTFDAALRYVDSLSSIHVPSYFELDTRLAWRISKHWEVSVVGQNLLHSQHLEFGPTAVQLQQTEIPRSVYGKIAWQF